MTSPAPVSLTTVEQVVLTASETNAEGGAVTPADVLTWAADSSAVTLTPAADGLTCVAVGSSAGTANVTVTDPGASLTSAALQIVVSAAPATTLDITAGTPEPQAPAA